MSSVSEPKALEVDMPQWTLINSAVVVLRHKGWTLLIIGLTIDFAVPAYTGLDTDSFIRSTELAWVALWWTCLHSEQGVCVCTINTCNDIQHNNISHLPNLFLLQNSLFSFIFVFPVQVLLFITLWGVHLVTDQDSVPLAHSPPFSNLFLWKHLSSKWIDVGRNRSLWPRHCCRLTVIQLRRS